MHRFPDSPISDPLSQNLHIQILAWSLFPSFVVLCISAAMCPRALSLSLRRATYDQETDRKANVCTIQNKVLQCGLTRPISMSCAPEGEIGVQLRCSTWMGEPILSPSPLTRTVQAIFLVTAALVQKTKTIISELESPHQENLKARPTGRSFTLLTAGAQALKLYMTVGDCGPTPSPLEQRPCLSE